MSTQEYEAAIIKVENEIERLEEKLCIKSDALAKQIMEKEERLRLLEQRLAVIEVKISNLDSKLATEVRALREIFESAMKHISNDVKELNVWKNKVMWLVVATCISSIGTLIVFILTKLI